MTLKDDSNHHPNHHLLHHLLQGKIAWVTGGASGIGAACCKAFADAGASVVCTDIQVEEGKALVQSLQKAASGNVVFFEQDVTDEARWQELAGTIKNQLGGLHVLVNNAGIGNAASILETTLEAFRHMVAINLESVFLGTKTCIPLIDQSGGGAIVNISSVAGLRGAPNLSTYCATKGAVRLYTKSTALECAGAGLKVRCNSVHPGIIETPIWNDVVPNPETSGFISNSEEEQAKAANNELATEGTNMSVPRMIANNLVPGGEVGLPSNIADAVVFLASERASYINGSELVVDSAMTAS